MDLMSLEPIRPTQPEQKTLWLFLSVAYGWIAYGDFNTESLRYYPSLHPDARKLGDIRFTFGVGLEWLKKRTYPCSVATWGDLVNQNPTLNETQQRNAIKADVLDHYRDSYPAPVTDTATMGNGLLPQLIGTQRPQGPWDLKKYENMFSFYAGKVCFPLIL